MRKFGLPQLPHHSDVAAKGTYAMPFMHHNME